MNLKLSANKTVKELPENMKKHLKFRKAFGRKEQKTEIVKENKWGLMS